MKLLPLKRILPYFNKVLERAYLRREVIRPFPLSENSFHPEQYLFGNGCAQGGDARSVYGDATGGSGGDVKVTTETEAVILCSVIGVVI